jgi:hypothetical protein
VNVITARVVVGHVIEREEDQEMHSTEITHQDTARRHRENEQEREAKRERQRDRERETEREIERDREDTDLLPICVDTQVTVVLSNILSGTVSSWFRFCLSI